MIEQLNDLPEYTLGFRASGEVIEDDYRCVLIPAVESALEKKKRVRLLYVLDESFDGYSAGAAWEDAKVGLTHFTHFDRVAVVTSSDWIRRTVKAFGFVMPGEVRVFNHGELDRAREWVSVTPSKGDLSFEFLDDQGVLILHPKGELEVEDFERVSEEIDPHIEKTGTLTGLVIIAESFPGWDDLSAFLAHMRFVRHNRKNIRRLALVTDDKVMSSVPRIASHFAGPEARHFQMAQRDEALAWASQRQ